MLLSFLFKEMHMNRFLLIFSATLLAGSTALSQTASQFTPDSLTRALWHFNELSGNVAHDTALGNDGSAFGTTIVPGRFGNARSFNGTSDYLSIPSSAAFDFDASGFRIDAWFKTTQADGIILRRGLAPDPGFMISLLHGHVVGMIGNRVDLPYPNELLSDTSNATFNDNAWHVATMVRDRTTAKLFLYVDGGMAGNPANDNFTILLNSTRPLTIGCWENLTYASYFAGVIDEVKITGSNAVRWPVRIMVQPGRLDFGGVRVSSRDTLGMQVTNAGYADSLRITSITSNNSHFSVQGGPTALGPGSHQTFGVLYVPTALQTDTGTVTIASNDPSFPSLRIPVTGRGIAIRDTPWIEGISFIPNTYNTQARIFWTRSIFDTAGAPDPVTGYSVWHRVPGPTWEFIQSMPAIGLDVYSLTLQVPVTTSGTNSWQVYMVVAQRKSLATIMSAPDSIRGVTLVGINGAEVNQAPVEVTLKQNYPNPFNPTTIIRYGLPFKTTVCLAIYNTLGQTVATLVDGEQEAGFHEARFDGSNLASGIYFCRLKADRSVRTSKLLLVR